MTNIRLQDFRKLIVGYKIFILCEMLSSVHAARLEITGLKISSKDQNGLVEF